MNFLLKGISIILLVPALLLLTACGDQEVTAPDPPPAAELLPSPTAPPPTNVSGATETSVPPTSTPTVKVEPSPTMPPVSSPTIIIPTPELVRVPPTATPAESAPEPPSELLVEAMPRFAMYSPRPVDTTPSMFHDPIAPDMSNVLVPFALSPDQLARLGESGVVVSPGTEKEFFTVYEKAR